MEVIRGIKEQVAALALPEGVTLRLTEADAAAKTAQFLLLGAALRLDRFFYYAWDNYRSGMIDRQGRATPRFEALRRSEQWLLGAQVTSVESVGVAGVRIDAARGTERFALAWSELDRPERIALPAGWKIASCESLRAGARPAWPLASGDATSVALAPAPVCLRWARA